MISVSSAVRTALIISVAVALTVVLYAISPPRQAAKPAKSLVIGPLAGSSLEKNQRWIEIRDRKIAWPQNERLSDIRDGSIGAGLYAAPGLVDMHVHFPPRILPGHVDLFGLLFLTHGVTSVRDMGTIGTNVASLAAEIEAGDQIGPRVFSCGTPLTGSPPSAPFAASVLVDSDVNSVVDQNAIKGADCIKIFRGFPENLLRVAKAAADKHGLPLVGHLPIRSSWDETRISDIQHICDPRCFSLRDPALDALIQTAGRTSIRHTPTLVAFDGPQRTFENHALPGVDLIPRIWREILWAPETLRLLGFRALDDSRSHKTMHDRVMSTARRLVDGGATIQAGSDTPHPFVVPGASLHHEMRLLSQAGMSFSEVWDAATKVPGEFLPLERLGTLKPGAPADILLFREDPRKNLNALDSLEIVIASGRVYHVSELRQRLQKQTEYIEGPLYEFGIEPAARATLRLLERHPEWLNATDASQN